MATLLLVRHGRTAANAAGILAGHTPGVMLDDRGVEQSRELARRLATVPLARIVSSPLPRCRQTADDLVATGRRRPAVEVDDRFAECHYGDWTGRELASLTKERLWRVVQDQPSAAVFPGDDGESLRGMQARAVDAARDWDARVTRDHGDAAVWVAVSHGDVIKAIVADALGLHLDFFQRIVVDPCSLTVIRYSSRRPFLVRLNDVGGDVNGLRPARRRRSRSAGDADVGGGAGTSVPAGA